MKNLIAKIKSKLPYKLQSFRNPYLNKIDGIWVHDDFDLGEMKPKMYILTGELQGVIITLVSIHIDEETEKASYRVTLEKDGQQFIPKPDAAISENELTKFIHKILVGTFSETDFDGLKDNNESRHRDTSRTDS